MSRQTGLLTVFIGERPHFSPAVAQQVPLRSSAHYTSGQAGPLAQLHMSVATRSVRRCPMQGRSTIGHGVAELVPTADTVLQCGDNGEKD